MLIEIRTQGLSLDAAVAGLVRRQVGDALIVHDLRAELHATIASALKRARHSLGRRLGRQRDHLSPSTLTQAPQGAGDLS